MLTSHPSSPSSPPQLPAVRDLELVAACEELKLERLVKWLMQILERPADVCEVRALPPDVYVHLARKVHVKFEGPPTPSTLSPRASFTLGSSQRGREPSPLSSFLPGTLTLGIRGAAASCSKSMPVDPSRVHKALQISRTEAIEEVSPPSSNGRLQPLPRRVHGSGSLSKSACDIKSACDGEGI